MNPTRFFMKCHTRSLALAALLVVSVAGAAYGGRPMLDPATDDPTRPWCYLNKSTVAVGVPFQPDVAQVTFDGAVYTGCAELCFFTGEPLKPVLAREKEFLDGWIPCVTYCWQDGDVAYDLEVFTAIPRDPGATTNTLQMARIGIKNAGDKPADAVVAAAIRHSGGDHRFRSLEAFNPDWRYQMTDEAALRDGRLLAAWTPEPGVREAVPGVEYEGPFAGPQHHVTARAEVCVATWRRRLEPGAGDSVVFRMPRVPISAEDKTASDAVLAADYAEERRRMERYWRDFVEGHARFTIPEKRVENAAHASLVHLALATRSRGGERFQTSGLTYPNFFMIDFVDQRLACEVMGHAEMARESFPQILKRQLDDGLFCDTSLTHGAEILSSHGQSLHGLAQHVLMTRDAKYGREILPAIEKAADWIIQAHRSTQNGLMPPSSPYDAEMILGCYTSHNLWALLALRSAIRYARFLGEDELAGRWTEAHDSYEKAVLKAIDESAHEDGYVPTGLYEYKTGEEARDGFREYQTDQDWENLLLAWPTEVLMPNDPRVAGTAKRMRATKYREGIMTYRNGQHLHQYLTTNVTNQFLAMGVQSLAVEDLYHILLHCGSTHEGYENMVEPWTDRDATNWPPPHAWAAAKITVLVRNMLVHEYGGRAGLDPEQRCLRLFSAVSPAWAKPGDVLGFDNVVTEMGVVSALMRFQRGGARVEIKANFHTPPARIVLHIPYFVDLVGWKSDADMSERVSGAVLLTPDVTSVELTWREKPDAHTGVWQNLLRNYRRENGFELRDGEGVVLPGGEGVLTQIEEARGPAPLSFDLVREAFQHEWARRFDSHVPAGGEVVRVEAPSMLTAEERRQAFGAEHGDRESK